MKATLNNSIHTQKNLCLFCCHAVGMGAASVWSTAEPGLGFAIARGDFRASHTSDSSGCGLLLPELSCVATDARALFVCFSSILAPPSALGDSASATEGVSLHSGSFPISSSAVAYCSVSRWEWNRVFCPSGLVSVLGRGGDFSVFLHSCPPPPNVQTTTLCEGTTLEEGQSSVPCSQWQEICFWVSAGLPVSPKWQKACFYSPSQSRGYLPGPRDRRRGQKSFLLSLRGF